MSPYSILKRILDVQPMPEAGQAPAMFPFCYNKVHRHRIEDGTEAAILYRMGANQALTETTALPDNTETAQGPPHDTNGDECIVTLSSRTN
jgi:hypothetical protein